MIRNKVAKPVALAVGAALAGSFAATSVANADSGASPFAMTTLVAGYMLGAGEGTCGGDKAKADKKGDKAEGSCGGDKQGEGSCGGDKEGEGNCGGDKEGEGNCGGDKEGEGSCGGDKEKDSEGKCGEGKCGGDKDKEDKQD